MFAILCYSMRGDEGVEAGRGGRVGPHLRARRDERLRAGPHRHVLPLLPPRGERARAVRAAAALSARRRLARSRRREAAKLRPRIIWALAAVRVGIAHPGLGCGCTGWGRRASIQGAGLGGPAGSCGSYSRCRSVVARQAGQPLRSHCLAAKAASRTRLSLGTRAAHSRLPEHVPARASAPAGMRGSRGGGGRPPVEAQASGSAGAWPQTRQGVGTAGPLPGSGRAEGRHRRQRRRDDLPGALRQGRGRV